MADTIYVMRDDGRLISMQPHEYDVEDVLQRLLAEHPELMNVGANIEVGPTRWLLVAREAGIPDDGGADRFSLDHLFLDSNGVPTLVEVKRSSDSRIRREVVGQMLDYASHFVAFWTVERVRAKFEATCTKLNMDPEQTLILFIGEGRDREQFWQLVKTNIEARRIRLLFVADRVPAELRRIVEFLNEVTNPVEVLAIEIPQYQGEGLRTFVPRVIGQSVAAASRKVVDGEPKRRWDEARFMEAVSNIAGSDVAGVARQLLAWARIRGLRIWWGEGATQGSFFPLIDASDGTYWTFAVWTYGKVEIQFQFMDRAVAFRSFEQREELLSRFNQIPGILISEKSIRARPSLKLSVLARQEVLDAFIQVWDWYIAQIRASE